jgi:hypothetical protein
MRELSYCVDRSDPVTVVRLAGELLLRDVPTVRGVLLKCLAECPDGVVVDLAGMTVAQPIMLTVFAAVRDRGVAWPAVPLLLAGATGATATALTRNALRRRVPVYSSVAEAVAAARRELPCGRLQLHLRPTTAAAAQARLLVNDACTVWALDHLGEVATLISSELVENAVFHARTECVFTVAYRGRYLHLSVEDQVPAPARLRIREKESGDPVGGRGLRLVQAFATAWGTFPTPYGKTTWATVRADS